MANMKAVYQRPLGFLDNLGEELAFYVRALALDAADDRAATRRRSSGCWPRSPWAPARSRSSAAPSA